MRTQRTALLLLLVLLIPIPLRATTYLVPDDRELIAIAKAIVTGTVTGTYTRRSPSGLIETVSLIAVEERIKGAVDAPTIEVVLPGGRLGEERMTVAGVRPFSPGERVLLFLDRNGRGDWMPFALALGAFRFSGSAGKGVLDRGGAEIFGWTRDGARHVERIRMRDAFLEFVRATARGEESVAGYFASVTAAPATPVRTAALHSFSSGSYALRSNDAPFRPSRRIGNGLTVSWRLSGEQRDLDLAAAVDAGNATWNGQSSLVHYSRGTQPAFGNITVRDFESRVIADDPNGDIPGSCCGHGILAWAVHHDFGDHPFNGETFRTIVEADIVINDGMSSANFTQEKLDDVLIHELGHTLGLRHSDQNDSGGDCAAPRDCCVDANEGGHCGAIMGAFLTEGISGLQPWDRDAIGCLYGGQCAFNRPCVPPSIFVQPIDKTAFVGGGTSLQAQVRGTPPLSPQWFRGTTGDTTAPVGTSWDQRVEPSSTTSYWLRVTGTCGDPANSSTATVTVQPCPRASITSAIATNGAGGTVILTAEATGASPRYRWFRGETPGVGGALAGTARQVTVTVTERSSFWVRVDTSCDNTAVSDLVYAAPCGLPSIVTQPSSQGVPVGSKATLSIVVGGAGGTVSWYEGSPPDKSRLAGSGLQMTTGAITTTTTYWAEIANACGAIPSRVVTVEPVSSRRRSSRH